LVSLGYKYDLKPEKAQLPAEPQPANTCQIASDRRTKLIVTKYKILVGTKIPSIVSRSKSQLRIVDTGNIGFKPNLNIFIFNWEILSKI
jgi:hypothetical protein